MMAKAAAAPQFQQENFSEYHLYSLGRRTSVEDKETKQISLLQGSGVPVEKIFVVNGQNYYYHNAAESRLTAQRSRHGLSTNSRMKKKPDSACLFPPATSASIRKIPKGGILFVGEDRIDHTPKDETVTIHIGNAFDVVAEHKQTDYKSIASHVWEMEFEITIRNHKDAPITVEVNEPIGGDWEMLSSTYKYTKTAAFAAQFNVPVAKDGKPVLKYRIRAHW